MADIIDINVLETVEEVTINVVDNVIQVNINKITGTAVTNTSELINDGEDGVHPYITLLDLPSNLILYPTTVASDVSGYVKLVTDIHDPEYNSTAVDVSTGSITTTAQLISSLITVPNLINGNPGVFNISTIGNIRRTTGSGTAEFYFNIYKRDALGTETLIGISNPTLPSSSAVYAEFNSTALWDDGIFSETDRIVLKFYANRISGGSNPTYEFQFGGLTPVRTLVPIPLSVVPNNGLQSVTGTTVDNTDPLNPIVNVPTLQQVTDAGNVVEYGAETTFAKYQTSADVFAQVASNGDGFVNFEAQQGVGEKTIYSHGAFKYLTGGGNFSLNFPSDNGSLGFLPVRATSNFTADNDKVYNANGTLTVTDPTPIANKGFIVHVIGGSVTIGGVAYTSGALVYRYYDGAVWISTDMNSAITIDATPTDGSANAVSSNGVFDALATKFELPALTSGSVLFSNGSTIAQDNSNLFWDDTNNRLGIGTNAPSKQLDIVSSGTAEISVRSTSANGYSSINFFNSSNNIVGGLGYGNASVAAAYANKFYFAGVGSIPFSFIFNGIEVGRFAPTTGNLLLNTTTDAGFRLDVNGTARVQNAVTINGDAITVNAQTHKVFLNATTNGTSRMYIASTASGALFNTGFSLVSGTTSKWSLASYGATFDFTFYNDGLNSDALFIKGSTNNVILGSTTDIASAILNVNSTTKGFLPPRMTTTQKNAIATPTAGLVVYDTTLNKLCVRTASTWETITSL